MAKLIFSAASSCDLAFFRIVVVSINPASCLGIGVEVCFGISGVCFGVEVEVRCDVKNL
jgi:hypothetical protein